MRIRSISLLFVLFLAACRQTPQSLDSGIEGVVTVGPMCPVMRVDTPCPDQFYQAKLTVLTTGGKKIMQFQTDENGRFRIALAAGDYVLHPESPNGLPSAADKPFNVEEHKFTQLEISYDSGIR
ncbi:MAG: carboxypeptidase regulatory-like domain-containing protein [Chloroflexi bacterium]|nr:carboxypeptidase regulatory-like domain-containing protein [Chloroflexota bacterium]